MNSILFAILIVILITALAHECPNPLYQRFSTDHTGCKQPNPQCSIVRAGMTQAEKNEVIKIHNSLRQKLASGGEQRKNYFPAASNMMKIIWDVELAFIAQAHANQCKFQHDCDKSRMVDEYSVGQNLYKTMSDDPSPGANWTEATESWYEEISESPKCLVDDFQSPPNRRIMWGHFTQIIWAETWKIGCGFTAYESNMWAMEKLYTCNYGPTGNILGEPMYKSGTAASQCPGNTAPARDYSALCEAADSTGPKDANEKKLRDTSLFYCDFSEGTVCGLKIQHENNAFIIRNNLFQYLCFKLSASQKASLELPNPVKSTNGFCVTFVARKGANDAKDRANNKLQMVIKDEQYASTQPSIVTLGINSIDWVPNQMDLSSFTRLTSIKLTFEVPAGANQQVLEIRSIVVTSDECQ